MFIINAEISHRLHFDIAISQNPIMDTHTSLCPFSVFKGTKVDLRGRGALCEA